MDRYHRVTDDNLKQTLGYAMSRAVRIPPKLRPSEGDWHSWAAQVVDHLRMSGLLMFRREVPAHTAGGPRQAPRATETASIFNAARMIARDALAVPAGSEREAAVVAGIEAQVANALRAGLAGDDEGVYRADLEAETRDGMEWLERHPWALKGPANDNGEPAA